MMFQPYLVIFPTPASDSTVSPRNHCSFFWRKLFREDLGTNMFPVTRISLLFASLRTEPRHVHMCTNIHIHMSIFISEFCICIYMKNHGFLWISLTPKKTEFIMLISLSVASLSNIEKLYIHYLLTQYIHLFVQTQKQFENS